MGTDPRGLYTWWDFKRDLKLAVDVAIEFRAGVERDVGHAVVGAADLVTLGTISDVRARVTTFRDTEGTLSERAEAANRAGTEARLNTVTLGFYGAEDKLEHAKELVGAAAIQRAGTLYGEAVAEGDWEKGLQATGELLSGTGQVAGTALLVVAPAAKAGLIPMPGAAAPAAAARGAGSPAAAAPAAGEGTTRLFRAVKPAELDDLAANSGAFRNPPGVEVKYFATEAEGAASYARQAYQRGGALYEGPYTIVETEIPTTAITPEMVPPFGVDRGISTIVVPTEQLPILTPARPLNYTPLPPG
jgi:hypothetical protein